MFFISLIIISLSYFTLIITLIIGFDNISIFSTKKEVNYKQFSIIIPFRNEAENLSSLAISLLNLDYATSNYEVIFVNDGSTDNSVSILKEFLSKNGNWIILDNERKSNSSKKDAITKALQQAKYDWIITTDGDCELPVNWLQCFNSFIQANNGVKMIAAPVTYKIDTSFLQQFQQLDFLSLIGTTIGSFGINKPFMCNGANLGYQKQAFFDVNGFNGNHTIASGDDVFLLEKFQQHFANQVTYLKSTDALVVTKPETSFRGLINQRIRWASKTAATKSFFSKLVGFLVLLMSFISFWSLIFGFWFSKFSLFLVLILVAKIGVDYVLIYKTYKFTNQKLAIKTYLLSSLVYPFFIIYVIVKSFFTKVTWKGRTI